MQSLPLSLSLSAMAMPSMPMPAALLSAKPRTSAFLTPMRYQPVALSLRADTTGRLPLARVAAKAERPEIKLLIGAGVSLGYEFALGHFLEFIKIMKQTRPGDSYATLAKDMVGKKGFFGIWDGFFPWGALQGIAKGAVFAWGHAFTKKTLLPLANQGYIGDNVLEVIAGGMGGGVQGFALSPLLLLKTRVMTDAAFRQKMTPWETSKKSLQVGMRVIRNEGITTLMKGSVVFSLKRVADWGTRFFFCVLAEELVYKRGNPDYKLTSDQKLAASLMGGVGSGLVTLPMDVMVAQIQQASKAGAKVTIGGLLKEQFAQGGAKQVFVFCTTGLVPRMAHVCFTTMIMKSATSIIYDMLGMDEK